MGPEWDYCLRQPNKCADTLLYHINLLKWVEPVPVVSAFATLPTDPSEHTLIQQDLTPTQNEELTELVDQFADIISSTPGLTHLVYHEIKIPPGVVV